MAGGRFPSIWVMPGTAGRAGGDIMTAGNERRRRQPVQDGLPEAQRADNQAPQAGSRRA